MNCYLGSSEFTMLGNFSFNNRAPMASFSPFNQFADDEEHMLVDPTSAVVATLDIPNSSITIRLLIPVVMVIYSEKKWG